MEVLLYRGFPMSIADGGMTQGKTGKGVSNSIIQPRDVGSANYEAVYEGKEGNAADKVNYLRRLGVFRLNDGYD